jgi:hypothetical protein
VPEVPMVAVKDNFYEVVNELFGQFDWYHITSVPKKD